MALVCVLGARAGAEPVVLKFATIIPDGSAYAREAKAFARDVEAGTQGRVRVKWIFGAVAGDEAQSLERLKRGQLDGAAVALACGWLAPSLKVFRLPGMFGERQEARQVLARLRATVAEELSKNGFTLVGMEPFGSDIVLSHQPVRSMADLKRTRFWLWDQDEVWRAMVPLLGLKAVPLPVESVLRAVSDKQLDGVISLPTAALAYQWSSQFQYFTPLTASYLQACLIVTNRAFDALSLEDKSTVRAAGAKAAAHFDKVCEAQDASLVGGLFEKQGLKRVPVSAELKSAFVAETRAAMEKVDEKLVPKALRDRVAGWLAEIRRGN
jgi:TRAP-type C4-dicarboxylate transport system substrate-binding protein